MLPYRHRLKINVSLCRTKINIPMIRFVIKYSVTGQLYCEFKYASFSCVRRRLLIPDAEEKALSSALCRALQPAVCLHEFPNFQVIIFLNFHLNVRNIKSHHHILD